MGGLPDQPDERRTLELIPYDVQLVLDALFFYNSTPALQTLNQNPAYQEILELTTGLVQHIQGLKQFVDHEVSPSPAMMRNQLGEVERLLRAIVGLGTVTALAQKV